MWQTHRASEAHLLRGKFLRRLQKTDLCELSCLSRITAGTEKINHLTSCLDQEDEEDEKKNNLHSFALPYLRSLLECRTNHPSADWLPWEPKNQSEDEELNQNKTISQGWRRPTVVRCHVLQAVHLTWEMLLMCRLRLCLMASS